MIQGRVVLPWVEVLLLNWDHFILEAMAEVSGKIKCLGIKVIVVYQDVCIVFAGNISKFLCVVFYCLLASNLLFIESPAGVGWSYSNTPSDYTCGDASTGTTTLFPSV